MYKTCIWKNPSSSKPNKLAVLIELHLILLSRSNQSQSSLSNPAVGVDSMGCLVLLSIVRHTLQQVEDHKTALNIFGEKVKKGIDNHCLIDRLEEENKTLTFGVSVCVCVHVLN